MRPTRYVSNEIAVNFIYKIRFSCDACAQFQALAWARSRCWHAFHLASSACRRDTRVQASEKQKRAVGITSCNRTAAGAWDTGIMLICHSP
jgi:hypothetical protein